MKKFLFVFAALLTTMVAGAQEYISVKNGDLTELGKEQKMPVFVDFDYSKATINGTPTDKWLKEHEKEMETTYADQLLEAEKGFQYSLSNRYMKCTNDKATAKYTFKVTFGDFNPGEDNLASLLISNEIGQALMKTVNISVYRAGEDKPCIEMEGFGIPGRGDLYSERRTTVYCEIGQEICDKVKDAAKAAAKTAKAKK